MTTHAIDTNPALSIAMPATPSFAVRLVRWARQRASFHRTRRVLGRLPDEMLKDIGITRGEIDYLARTLRP